MAFTRKTEVRHISQAELVKIAEILNQPTTSPAWKKLMQIAPSELTDHEQLSDCKPKYNIQHIRSIETAAGRNNAAQIFLEEWMTSGRIRPTLSHLLQLLVKSESFRAADYVAINLLSEAPPQRPKQGPAVKVDISLPDDDVIDSELINGNCPNTSEIMYLNRCDEAASKNIASKQIFDRSSMPERPISEEDLIRMSPAQRMSQNVTATPVQTTNCFPPRPEHHVSQIEVPQVNGLPLSEHLTTHHTNCSTSHANKSPSSSRMKNEPVDRISSTHSVATSDTPHNFVPNFQLLNSRANHFDHPQSQENFVGNIPHFIDPSQSTSGREMSGGYWTDQQENISGYAPHLSELMQLPNNQTKGSTSAINPVEQFLSTQSVRSSHNFVPNFFFLNNQSDDSANMDVDIPNLSMLNIADGHHNDLNATKQMESSVGYLPHLSQLMHASQSTLDNRAPEQNSTDQQVSVSGNFPSLSQLMYQSQSTSNILVPEFNSTDQQESFGGNMPSQSMQSSQPMSIDLGPKLNSTDQQESFSGDNLPLLSQLMNKSTDSVVSGA